MRFYEGLFFDEILIGKRSAENPNICDLIRRKACHGGILGEGRRLWRGPLKLLNLQNTSEDPTRLSTPLCETGAADPNVPSGASTAAPVIGVWAVEKSQI